MIKKTKDGIILNLKISPNASKNEIIINNNELKIKITAQPIDGKANKSLIEFLSKYLKIPKSYFQIIKGQTSKEKSILIKNLPDDKINTIKDLLRL